MRVPAGAGVVPVPEKGSVVTLPLVNGSEPAEKATVPLEAPATVGAYVTTIVSG